MRLRTCTWRDPDESLVLPCILHKTSKDLTQTKFVLNLSISLAAHSNVGHCEKHAPLSSLRHPPSQPRSQTRGPYPPTRHPLSQARCTSPTNMQENTRLRRLGRCRCSAFKSANGQQGLCRDVRSRCLHHNWRDQTDEDYRMRRLLP
jgi:hypothetical protein